MTFLTLWNWQKPSQRRRHRAPRSIRLRLESLEDRITPSVPTDPIPYTPDTVFKLGNYWIDVPASYDPTHQTPTELLVWSHGCGGTSEGDIFDVLPTAGGPTYIAITVDGREGACWDVNADPPVILAAIADVETHFNIDPQRVVLGGYSSGGDLSYRIAFTHSTEIAGVLAENTSPFRDTGLTQGQALAAPFHFHVVHLAHTEDEAYPIDGVRAETDAVQAAGLPGDGWATRQRIERPGTHFDPDNGNTGTVHDLKTYLLPHLADGWTSPGIAAPTVTTNPSSQTVIAGQTATFTAAAGGNPAPAVQWQVSSDGGKTFTNISGATSTTLTLSNVQASQNGDTYRAVFSNNAGTAITSNATLTVNQSPPSPPPAAPTLQVPPLLAFFNSILGGIETVNGDGTVTVTDSLLGIPLLVSTYDSTGGLVNVSFFGLDVTALFK
jgi:predicted esterase